MIDKSETFKFFEINKIRTHNSDIIFNYLDINFRLISAIS